MAPLLHQLPALCLLALCASPVAIAVEPLVIVSKATGVYRNAENVLEIPHNQRWIFNCQWSRRNATDAAPLTMTVPNQNVPALNCQFNQTNAPAVCTPSYVEFKKANSTESRKSNVTCTQHDNTLTCSAELSGFNPYHIGKWACSDTQDRKSDTVYVQYYKTLPREHLVLASWDPFQKVVNDSLENVTINRFECFTTIAVIPPANLTFLLGGQELGFGGRYPISWMSDTVLTQEPNPYSLNETAATKAPPKREFASNQQFLASSKVVHLRLKPSYNGLLLQCVANQGIIETTPSRDLALTLDGRSGSAVPGLSAALAFAAASIAILSF